MVETMIVAVCVSFFLFFLCLSLGLLGKTGATAVGLVFVYMLCLMGEMSLAAPYQASIRAEGRAYLFAAVLLLLVCPLYSAIGGFAMGLTARRVRTMHADRSNEGASRAEVEESLDRGIKNQSYENFRVPPLPDVRR